MKIIIHILIQGSAMLVMYVIPFIYVLRTGKFWRGFFLTWVLCVLTVFVLSVSIPFFVYNYISPDFAVEFFPEAIGVPLVLFMGWIPGLVISSLAYLVRGLIKKIKKADGNR